MLRVYKKAAEMSLMGHPMGTQMQSHTFNCWAVALCRAGYLDMTEVLFGRSVILLEKLRQIR